MRVPPNSQETELALLACCLSNDDALDAAIARLSPDDFYFPKHGAVFKAMVTMRLEGEAVDPQTVSAGVEENGRQVVAAALDSEYVVGHINSYIDIVESLAVRRAAIKAAQTIQEEAYEKDADEVLDTAERLVYTLRRETTGEGPLAITSILPEVGQRLEEGRGHKAYRSPWQELDELTLGFSPGSYTIVAARPSQGKTCFALDLSRKTAKEGGVLFFSLEMTKEELVERLLAAESGVPLTRIRGGNLVPEDHDDIRRAIASLAKMSLYIDDSATTMGEIVHRVRRIAPKINLAMVVIDYIQLMTHGTRAKENRVQEVAQMSRAIKLLAREFNVPVIALSQLSRPERKYKDDDGGNKTPKPTLASLRDSGALEQDADQVIFLYREDDEIPEVTVQVAKNRSGPTGKITLIFHPTLVTFDPKED